MAFLPGVCIQYEIAEHEAKKAIFNGWSAAHHALLVFGNEERS